MRLRPRALVGAALLLTGCVTLREKPSILGRSVTVVRQEDGQKVRGELLAVGEDRLWIRTETEVRELPLQSVRRVDIRRHGVTARRALTFALVGALVTGTAMAFACDSVEDTSGCGKVGVLFGGAWLAAGGVSAASLGPSSRIRIEPPRAVDLRAFARFPQGLPAGLDPAAVHRPPPGR